MTKRNKIGLGILATLCTGIVLAPALALGWFYLIALGFAVVLASLLFVGLGLMCETRW